MTMLSKQDLTRLAECVRYGDSIQISYRSNGVRELSYLAPEIGPETRLEAVFSDEDLDKFIGKIHELPPIIINTEITDEMEKELFYFAKLLNNVFCTDEYKEYFDDPERLAIIITHQGLSYIKYRDGDERIEPITNFDSFISDLRNNFDPEEY
jgi:hypothetical protein